MTCELREGQYHVSTDPSLLDIDRIHAFLTASYWAERVPRDVVARSVKHSLPFGLYDGHAQIGFARVITDRATFAYLADVYIEEATQDAVSMTEEAVTWMRQICLPVRTAYNITFVQGRKLFLERAFSWKKKSTCVSTSTS